MMLRHKAVKRISRGAAVLALATSGFFGLAVTPAFANAPPAGWTFEGNWTTNSGCRAGGEAGEAAHEWTNYGCYQWPPGPSAPWGLYVTNS
jgi:hypothetical protein